MQQRVRRFAFFVGGVSLVAGALIVVACSSDNSTSSSGTNVFDGAKPDSAGKDSSDPQSDGGTDAPNAPDCAIAPKLRDNTNGFFCAFYRGDNGEGGTTSYCPNDEICCNTSAKLADAAFAPSFCAPGAAAGAKGGTGQCESQAAAENSAWLPDAGSAWECNDKAACSAGQVCCMTTQPGATGIVNIGKSLDKDIPAACDAKQAFKQGGTRCVTGTTCAADQIKLCSVNDNNCAGTSKCTAFSGFFRDLGYCFP